jgi:hypothetical protein
MIVEVGMKRIQLKLLLLFVAGLSFAGLGCQKGARCVAGQTVECACPGGTKGVQSCTSEGAYGACECSTAQAPTKDGAGGAAGGCDGSVKIVFNQSRGAETSLYHCVDGRLEVVLSESYYEGDSESVHPLEREQWNRLWAAIEQASWRNAKNFCTAAGDEPSTEITIAVGGDRREFSCAGPWSAAFARIIGASGFEHPQPFTAAERTDFKAVVLPEFKGVQITVAPEFNPHLTDSNNLEVQLLTATPGRSFSVTERFSDDPPTLSVSVKSIEEDAARSGKTGLKFVRKEEDRVGVDDGGPARGWLLQYHYTSGDTVYHQVEAVRTELRARCGVLTSDRKFAEQVADMCRTLRAR